MSVRDHEVPPPADSATYEELLERAAQRVRIEPEYWDIWGRHHKTPQATKEAILRSLGYDLTRLAEVFQGPATGRLVDPVSVLTWTGQPLAVAMRLPEGYREATVETALYTEDGSSFRDARPAAALAGKITLPEALGLGYHDLEVVVKHRQLAELRATQRLIVAPSRAWMPDELAAGARIAGLAISLYGLRSERNWGVGDFTDLAAMAEWVHESLGCAFVALNPLHAIANRQPYNTSPYLPLSSCYRNYLYLDVVGVDEYARSAWAQRLVGSEAFQEELRQLRASEYVEYERVARLKLSVLKLLYREFRRAHDGRRRAFRAWAAEQGELLDRFAMYCALDEMLRRRHPDMWIWPDWPEEYRDPESAAVEEFGRTHRRLVEFYKYLQWQIDVELEAAQSRVRKRGMLIGLYHDLALATDRCGADLWEYRKYFVHGCRVGAPPDDFAPEGQDWAFPPPNTEALREDGYRFFIATIRQTSRHGGALRIDHVMRFYRLFWIPDGLTALDGTYVRDRFEDLLGILALESHRGKFIVVGEDLGTVPQEMRDAMEHYGIFSYKLFYFERDGAGRPKRPQEYPRQALVSSTTHDLPTLAGYWAGRDIDVRRELGLMTDESTYRRQHEERARDKAQLTEALIEQALLPAEYRGAAEGKELTGPLHNAVIGYLVRTPSQLMLLNEEDLTKEMDQQNMPGTTTEYPNWGRKMSLSLEDLRAGAGKGFADMFRNWLKAEKRVSGDPESAQK